MQGPLRPGLFARRRATDSTFFVSSIVPASGPDGAATFALDLEPGAKITYSWRTSIFKSYSGKEQRVSYQALPAVRIEGQAFLVDSDADVTRTTLMRAAASGATFLVALPSEEAVTTAISGSTVTVADTSVLDWAIPGQRVAVIGTFPQDPDPPEIVTITGVVQSVTATQITVNSDLPMSVLLAGARIMPLVPVLLDPQQGFSLYPVGVHLWDLRARAVTYGWCGQDVMGAGASVLTFDAGLVAASTLTDDNLIIWDRANFVEGTAAETLATMAEVVDFGGVPFAAGGQVAPDWIRPIKLRSTDTVDYQWLKAVIRHLRGAQGMFLLPSTQAFAFNSVPAFGQIAVSGDYATWFESTAYHRLAVVTTSGITQYATALSVVDNGGGVSTISLDQPVFGPIDTVSIVEQVRLESDDVPIVWDGGAMACDIVAHAVQDTTATTEDIVTSAWAGSGLDGDFTFPVGTYSMTRDMYWETGELQSGSVIVTNGFVPHFRTALIGPASGVGTIQRNGNDASGATAGAGFASGTGTLSGGSGTGATGTTGAGAAAAAFGFWPTTSHPGFGGAGGSGTNAGAAGAGGPASLQADTVGSLDVFAAMRMRFMTGSTTAISGGAGGSSGGGSGTLAGGGGGGGAGNVVVAAGQYIRAENIAIQAIGGKGGTGAGTNCGGGGGGGGGLIAVAAGRLPFPSTITNTGGAGGAGGSGGASGTAGSPGPAPMLFLG